MLQGNLRTTRCNHAVRPNRPIRLRHKSDFSKVLWVLVSFLALRLGEGSKDMDMISFALVKIFSGEDQTSTEIPPLAPKKAFHKLAAVCAYNVKRQK